MPKYLRYLDLRTSLTGPSTSRRADPEIEALVWAVPGIDRLTWILEHYALPLESSGVAKVLIYLVQEPDDSPPQVIPLKPEDRAHEGMAEILQHIDLAKLSALSVKDQQACLVELVHTALTRCAEHFGWNREPFNSACERVLREGFQFEFDWKKPLASPDRKHKVQARVAVTDQLRVWLIFYDRNLNAIERKLICSAPAGGNGIGFVELVLDTIAWRDAETVCVTQKNKRDYWLCPISGNPEFHYPRAERGDPHGLYDLGLLYFEGRFVPVDKAKAHQLIEAAAANGFVHAKRWLDRAEQAGTAEQKNGISR